MRLFIAIELPEGIKAELEKSAASVHGACERGTFTRRENFHLTLAFLGETDPSRIREIIRLMDDCPSRSIPITIGHMGRFKRREGDVLWRQVEADKSLFQLQKTLAHGLRSLGLPLEDREFVPHLTLARRVVLKDGIKLRDLSAQMPDLAYMAHNMTLMQSKQMNRRTTYIPLHCSALDKLGTCLTDSLAGILHGGYDWKDAKEERLKTKYEDAE